MKWKLMVTLGILAVLIGFSYIQASPIGGANVSILDENGKPITSHGIVQYSIWTFDERGNIKIIKQGTLKKGFLSSGNTVELSRGELNEIRRIARNIGSQTGFVGIDTWVEENGRVYTLPPESFEIDTSDRNTLPTRFKIALNLKNAEITDIKGLFSKGTKEGASPQPLSIEYKWVTAMQASFQNVEIPILIINNSARSNIHASVDIGTQNQEYWGPVVTVAFGNLISKKVRFDPSSIKVKALGRSVTDYYRAGQEITVPEGSEGYIWIRGTVHYIYQVEYACYPGASVGSPGCRLTGNERYFAKIDRFTVNKTINGIKYIEKGSTLGMPPYILPNEYMEESAGINANTGDYIYLASFYRTIYTGEAGYHFGVGVPVGAIINALTGFSLPPWFNAIVVGFGVKDYTNYAMMGHLIDKGPDKVTFYAMESNYKMSIPTGRPAWKIWEPDYISTKIPVGFYIKVEGRSRPPLLPRPKPYIPLPTEKH